MIGDSIEDFMVKPSVQIRREKDAEKKVGNIDSSISDGESCECGLKISQGNIHLYIKVLSKYTKNKSDHLNLQEELRKKFCEETLPTFFTQLDKHLCGNNGGNGYFVGDSVSTFQVDSSDS